MDDQQRARELLAQEYERDGITHVPDCIRREAMLTEMEHRAIRAITAALLAAPDGFVLVPVDPTEEWVRAVIRTWQPNLKEGCKGWRELEDELLHWHTAMLAARPQGVKDV